MVQIFTVRLCVWFAVGCCCGFCGKLGNWTFFRCMWTCNRLLCTIFFFFFFAVDGLNYLHVPLLYDLTVVNKKLYLSTLSTINYSTDIYFCYTVIHVNELTVRLRFWILKTYFSSRTNNHFQLLGNFINPCSDRIRVWLCFGKFFFAFVMVKFSQVSKCKGEGGVMGCLF